MRSYLLFGQNDLRFCEISDPKPARDEVVVKVKSIGICGSDVHYYKDGKIGDFIPKEPFALGHEVSGIIHKESPVHPSLSTGTRVSINPSRPCNECIQCKTKKYNLCPNMKYLGSASVYPHLNGGFAEYITLPGSNCIPLDDSISFETGALLEPLFIVLHALSLAGTLKGKTLLITGAGTIGQLCHMTASLYTSEPIVITDPRPVPLSKAKELGVFAALNPENPNFGDNLHEVAPDGFDLLIEASGASSILPSTVKFMKMGGMVIQLGMYHDHAQFPFAAFMRKELTFQPSFRFNQEFPKALELVRTKKINLTDIITDNFQFDHIPEAMQRASGTESIKIMVEN